MKIFWIVLAVLVLGYASWALVNYLLQKRRQDAAQREGVVVYATVVSIEPGGRWAKQLNLKKIVLRLQEPGATSPREVTLRTRVEAGQKIGPGIMLVVVIDPKDPKRIYPANPDAAKRVVLTGSRQERRFMKAGISGARPGVREIPRDPVPMPRNKGRR